MASSSDFTKITVGVGLEEGLDIRKANTYLKQFQDVIKNLTDEGLAFSSALRKTTDKISQDLYVPTRQLGNVKKAFDSVRASAQRVPTEESDARASDPLSYDVQGTVEMLKMQKKILGNRRVIAKYMSEIKRHGGSMEAGIKENYYDITVPNVDLGDGKSSFARKLNKDIARENSEVRAREEAVVQAKEDKDFDAKDAYGRKITSKRTEERLKNEDKAASLSAASKAAKVLGGSSGRGSLDSLKGVAAVMVMIKLLKELLDVTKKIFTAMVSSASVALAQSLSGMRFGMSTVDIMRYGAGETAKGLAPGTMMNAVGSAQAKWGNITQLDTKSIELLAVVMGAQIKPLIESGIGGENPVYLIDTIIKGFMDQALAGKNSIGQVVGPEAAIRELTSYLSKVDPNIAAMFNRQLLDVLSATSSASTVASGSGATSSWLLGKESITNPTGQTALERGVLSEIANILNEIKALVSAIMSGLTAELTLAFSAALGPLRNGLRFLMSDSAKEEDVVAAVSENEALRQELEQEKVVAQKRIDDTENVLKAGRSEYFRDPSKIKENVSTLAAGALPEALYGIGEEELQAHASYAAAVRSMEYLNEKLEKIDAEAANEGKTGRVFGGSVESVLYGSNYAKGILKRIRNPVNKQIAKDQNFWDMQRGEKNAEYERQVSALSSGETAYSSGAALEKKMSKEASNAIVNSLVAGLMTAEASEGKGADKPLQFQVIGGESLITVRLYGEDNKVLQEKTITNILGIKGQGPMTPIASAQQKPVSTSEAYRNQVRASTGGQGQ